MTDARSLLIAAMRRHALGGSALAVVRTSARPAFEYVGLADRGTNRAIDSSTVFRIASISKTMTAIGVMQLRDRGLLDLDQPVNAYLKSFTVESPGGGAPVTIRHLLTHTSGIGELPRVPDLVRRDVWGVGPPNVAGADLGALYRGTLRTETAAGAKWSYANHGFAVLAQVVEDVSGEPFSHYMREHVFAPLGMNDTDYRRTDRSAAQLAVGYHWVFRRFRDIKDYDLSLLGPGSVLSTATDMATYAEWLLHGGRGAHGDVLDRTTLDEMMSPQHSVDPRLPGMGLAFFLNHLGAERVAGHDGGVPGFASALLVAPDAGIAVVVLTNTSTFMGASLLAKTVLGSELGVVDPAPELSASGVEERPHLWSELLGHYAPRRGLLTNLRTWQMTGGEVQIVIRKRRLVIRSLSPLRPLRRGLPLRAVDHDDPLLFAFEIEGLVVPVAFARDSTGRVTSVSVGPPGNIVFHRRRALRSSRNRLRIAAVALAATVASRLRTRS